MRPGSPTRLSQPFVDEKPLAHSANGLLRIILVALFLLSALVSPANAQAETEGIVPEPGRIEGVGTHFEVHDSRYLNVALDSSEPINLVLESVPEMVTLQVEAASGATSTVITLSGFPPLTTFHKYEDSYENHTVFTADALGGYTYTQDLSGSHLVFIQPRASTKFLRDNATGGDCTLIGIWSPATKTCTLTTDVTETIEIRNNGITLDGQGHRVTGNLTGYGVLVAGWNGITIKNLIINGFTYGIGLNGCSACTVSNNTTSANSWTGIFLVFATSNTLSNNTVSGNAQYGIYFCCQSNYNTLSYNAVNGNGSEGILIAYHQYWGSSSYNSLLYNTISNNGGTGINVSVSNYNSLIGNTISNHYRGVLIAGRVSCSISGCRYSGGAFNQVYNNNFISNTVQAQISTSQGGNVFNLAAPIGGNYWSNYDTPAEGCHNLNGDNFCDAPLYLPFPIGAAVDNLPWTRQSGWAASPPVADAGGPYQGDEGTSITLDASASSDPDNDIVTYEWDLDNDGQFDDATRVTTQVVFDDNGSFTVGVRVTDGAGLSGTDTAAVTVGNVAPRATFSAETPVNEGSPFALSLTDPSDPSPVDTAAGFTYAFDCGDGPGYGAFGPSNTASCPTADNGTRTVGGKIRDKDGGVTEYATTVNVSNLPPTIGSVAGPASPLPLGSSASLTASYSDPSSLDTHACTFAWDDTTSTTVPGSAGSCTATHTYAAAGVYTVLVTVVDDDGGSAASTYEFVVIYDPAAGFVTGGGWIASPAGAYTAGPSLSGKATFGFVSKYQKGATEPTGNTEFQFHAAGFNFKSSNYQWLVVAGAKAQYKGTGTVNGASGYGFLLTATDGQVNGGGDVDKFRLKVWELASGNIVYDNALGASEDIDSANPQAIDGGSIAIHSK